MIGITIAGGTGAGIAAGMGGAIGMMIVVSVAGIAIEPTFDQATAGLGASRPAVGISDGKNQEEKFETTDGRR